MSVKSHAAALAAALASLAALGAGAPAAHADLITPILTCDYPLVGPSDERIQFTSDVGSPAPLRGVPAPTFGVTAAYGITDGLQQSGRPAATWRLLGAASLEGTLDATVTLNGAGLSQGRTLTFPIPRTVVPTNPDERAVLQGTATHPSVTYPTYGPVDLSFDSSAPVTLHLIARRADGSVIIAPPNPNLPDDLSPETFDISCTTRVPSDLIESFQVLHGDPGLPGVPQPKLAELGAGKVVLSWPATTWPDGTTTQPATSYDVIVKDAQTGATVTTVTTTSPSVTLTTELANRTKYSVSVVAKYAGAASQPSAPVVFTTLGPPGPLTPVVTGLAPNTGPTEGGNEVIVKGVFAGTGELRSVTFGGKPATVISQETLQLIVKAPSGTVNSTVDVVVNTANGASQNTAADDYTYRTVACECLNYSYNVTGSATLKTLAKGTVPLTGTATDGLIDLAGGAFSLDLALNRATAKLVALGFLPVTAQLQFVNQSRLTGTLKDGVLTGSQKVRIKLPKVTLLGLPIVGAPTTCQTRTATNIAVRSTDGYFDSLAGGGLAGTFAISDLTGCGGLTGLVSSLTAGKSNAIALKLTAQG